MSDIDNNFEETLLEIQEKLMESQQILEGILDKWEEYRQFAINNGYVDKDE